MRRDSACRRPMENDVKLRNCGESGTNKLNILLQFTVGNALEVTWH
ncbi:MAG: hypothetical protein V4635_10350 [Bacteroidota bacterium]